jgi:hypothetical protein
MRRRPRARKTRRKLVPKRRSSKKVRAGQKPRSKKVRAPQVLDRQVRGPRVRAPKLRVPRPDPAELRLLALAQDMAASLRAGENGQALSAPLLKLAAAYGPSAPLPHEVFRARIRSRNDKTAALALSWAREQVRLGLQELVERTKGPRSRVDVDAETLAWLLLAGCEAIAQEPPSAVADRVRVLLQLIGHPPAGG